MMFLSKEFSFRFFQFPFLFRGAACFDNGSFSCQHLSTGVTRWIAVVSEVCLVLYTVLCHNLGGGFKDFSFSPPIWGRFPI